MLRAVIPILMLAGLLVLGTPEIRAQTNDSGPALGVARVSLINGDVTTRRGQDGDWVAADVNTPLVEGDTIETGPGSRTEVQLDYSNLIRLAGSTSVELAALGNRNFRVRVLQGRVTYSELKGGEADVDLETPFVAVRPRKNGRYEIEVGPGETVIQVRRGEAEIASADGIEKLDRGRMMIVRGSLDGGLPEFRFASAEPSGDWDRWNESRDEKLARAESYRYVDRSISGAQDLDYHGDWRYVSGYGHCWFPRVNYGWAPYRHGRWTWVDYYGWSWVGYEPWGWAPYHYGRWFHHAGYGWAWYPGPRRYRHSWSPALVAFFGYSGRSGFSVGVGVGFGRVGWVPLGPGERFNPWYGRGGGWGRGGRGGNVKIKNSTIIVDNSVNIYNNYRNARAHNGVTVVDAQGFSQGRVNNPQSLRSTELQRASLIRGQIPVVPDRQSQGRLVRAGASNNVRASNVRTFSRSAGQRTTARVSRTSFDAQRNSIAQSVRDFRVNRSNSGTSAGARGAVGGQGSSVRAGSAVRSDSGRAGVRSGSTVATPSSAIRSGSSRSAGVRSSAPSRAGESNGWRSFGDRSNSTARSGVRSEAPRSVSSPSRVQNSPSRVQSSPSRVQNSPSRQSSPSRVQRSTSRQSSPSRVQRSTSRQSSPSRVQRSTSRQSSPSRVQRSTSRQSSPSRVQRSAPQRSAPSMRSAPSRSSGGGARVQRSAPSRSGGGSVRSAPSRSSGGGARSGSRSSRGR